MVHRGASKIPALGFKVQVFEVEASQTKISRARKDIRVRAGILGSGGSRLEVQGSGLRVRGLGFTATAPRAQRISSSALRV